MDKQVQKHIFIKKSLFIFCLIYLLLQSCSSDSSVSNNPTVGNPKTGSPIIKTIPIVTTNTFSNITTTSASGGGNITSDGGDPVTSRGIVWSTSSAPTISLATKTTDGTGTGTFTSAIANLTPSTNYYARAYATNSVGTGYGNEITFTTGAIVLPTLTTTAVTSITSRSAISGGAITADGGGNIIAKGIVWSTSTNPTIALSTKTTDGIGTVSFSSTISNLNPSTRYYTRAYATNNAGTNYGAEVNFTTLTVAVDPITSVVIGTQTWATRNLDVSNYRDGTPIPQVTDPTAWSLLTTGAWCYYDNSGGFGKLYNWYAVAGIHDTDPNTPNKELAPIGYHVPTDAEWTTLTTFLGGASVAGGVSLAGGKMKTIGTQIWISPNKDATNSSGFSGLPGGYRNTAGPFSRKFSVGGWWSSSESNIASAHFRGLTYNEGTVFYMGLPNLKTVGFSVRCIKD